MFTNIKLNNFRILKDKQIKLGKYITMLAGWNATGKSTVLALLANSTELKPSIGKTYNGKSFRAEFSEILKGSKKFDQTLADRLAITWEEDNGTNITKTFRTTWQKEKGKDRFRVIPRETDEEGGRKNEAKFDIPVIYLGLSRLFPIGETDDDFLKDNSQTFQFEEDKEWFITTYKKVLSVNDAISDITSINFESISKKTSGINTKYYDWKTNSAGQDNLSQILFSILSFKNLKRNSNSYRGGLLLIDEIESSLHPKAQQKLIDLLIKEAKDNTFQVVFTTHSLNIIEYFSHKKKSSEETIVSYYFTKANNELEIKENPSYEEMKEDLLLSLYKKDSRKKIIVYTEDEEARWFLKKLLKYKIPSKYLNILPVHISCSSLVDLMNCEPAFSNYIVIFDGDLSSKQEKRIKKNKTNYITLPTNLDKEGQKKLEPPEKCLETFILSEEGEPYLKKEHIKNPKVKIEFFQENCSSSCPGDKEREKSKNWFQNHKQLFERSNIMGYWKSENKKQVEDFIKKFKCIFNKIANKLDIEKI